jgi:hypothetical protein
MTKDKAIADISQLSKKQHVVGKLLLFFQIFMVSFADISHYSQIRVGVHD